MLGLLAIGLAVLIYGLASARLRYSMLTPPMAFVLFGLAIGAGGLDLMETPVSHGAIHTLAEITLALVLFSDAARMDLRMLLRDHDVPRRMLLVGLPLTIALGTIVAACFPLGLGWVEAALLAAVLAPTDAALGQAVVSNRDVPVRIRQALNVESGLNDGIAVPLVYLFAALLTAEATIEAAGDLFSFAARQLALGPIAGLAVGAIVGCLALRAHQKSWMEDAFEGPMVLATLAAAFALAESIGGNGFISVFVAGLIFGYLLDGQRKFILEFAEAEGQMLVLLAFLIFGAVMLPELAGHVTWPMLLYAILSLTIIRMVPVALSLIGIGLSTPTVIFLGWFGPRGLASILFGLLVLEQHNSGTTKTILTTAVLTIVLSVFAHGATAAPLAQWYARRAERLGDCPDNETVPEMPTRISRKVS
ncbi:MAG: cation:proton antiporter [Hyphomicrobiaceae bacterium]